MGQDKGILPLEGKPLVTRVIERICPLADETFITTNRPEHYAFLGLRMVADIVPERGALGGLYTALETANRPYVIAIACDMPFANPEMIKAMQKLLLEKKADAIIPQSSNGLEPLHAIYRKETCLPPVKRALEAGKWRLISWHVEVKNILIFSTTQVKRYDPIELSFFNVNTPEEFRHAQEILRMQHPE